MAGCSAAGPKPRVKVDAVFAAIFNDADFGIDDAGISRLPALDARGIAGATVSAWSARIGDGRSTYSDGFVSAINATAARYGGEIGISAIEFVRPLRGRAEGTHDDERTRFQLGAPAQRRPSARRNAAGCIEVGPMFGMGGFQLLPFYEAVRALGLKHFLINDERCGAFAADAYARVTNRPGVCDGTLGPGATNLVTGLVESFNAGIPQVVHHRRRQPRPCLEEHDAGGAADRRSCARP